MKKLIGCLFGLFLVSCLVRPVHASTAISPKSSFVEAYTTTASTVTAGPGAIYEINLSTGAAGEFVAFFDTVTVNGTAITANTVSSASGFKQRFFYSSTTTSTQIKIDPPIIFYYGIQMIDSASAGSSLVTYEEGRGLSGQ